MRKVKFDFGAKKFKQWHKTFDKKFDKWLESIDKESDRQLAEQKKRKMF